MRYTVRSSTVLLCRILFVPYLLAVLWLTLFNREATFVRSEMTMFWEYANMLSGDFQRFYFQQIFCNILMLMPLGFMLPVMFRGMRSLLRIIWISFLFSTLIELTQFITARGLCEFDDIFNNTLGAAIGGLLFLLVFRRREP